MAESTYAVPKPVRRSRQPNSTRADRKREDLANDDPGTRAPGGGKEKDVDTDKGNLSLDGCRVRPVGCTGNADNKLADDHTGSTPDHNCTAAKSLNDVEGDWCRADVD